jgi:polar amino acid transport system substrate-binding protein
MARKLVGLNLAIAITFSLSLFPAAVGAADLATIVARGKLIVAVKGDLRPLGFSDSQGHLQGLEIDIARQLAQELLGNSDAVVLRPVTNQERLQVVMEGSADLAIAGVTATPSRARLVDFSTYYYLDGTGLVTKNPTIEQWRDLASRQIAVLNGSSTIAAIRSELPQARLIGVNSYQEALTLLEADKADAFAGDNSLLAGWVQDYPQYRQLPVRLSGDPLSIVIPKGLQYVELRERVNQAIARWKQSGWLQQRITYWGLPLDGAEDQVMRK